MKTWRNWWFLKNFVVNWEILRIRLSGIPCWTANGSSWLNLSMANFSLKTVQCLQNSSDLSPNLESLELDSSKTAITKRLLPLHHLKTLDCSPQFLDESYSVTRLRFDFENSTGGWEIDVLGRVLNKNLARNMKSLTIFLRQSQSHFPEIIRAIAVGRIYIQHLEIHQFFPTQVRP